MISVFARWARRLGALYRSGNMRQEDAAEMRFHVEMEAEELRRTRGLPPEEARRQALVAFGGVERHREAAWDARGMAWIGSLALDFKLGLRMWRKHVALSVVGGLGMALAIAIAVALFTFMQGFYYSHPPLPEGHRLVALENRNLQNDDDWRATLFDFHTWRESLASVEELAAFRRLTRTLQVPGGPVRSVSVAEMTASAFRAVRIPPLLGRPLLDADEVGGAQRVVVVGYEEWQRDLGGDRAVIGSELRLGERAYTVVGVMPEGFRMPVNDGYWTPLHTDPSMFGPGEGPRVFIFGRLVPGVTKEAAQAELTAVGMRTAAAIPEFYELFRPFVLPYIHPLLDVQQYPAWVVWLMQLFGVLILSVVAINVAILVYARTAARQAELTVRTALGAARSRIVAQLFVEALVMTLAAALLGLALANVGYERLFSLTNPTFFPYWIAYGRLSVSTIAYAVALAVVAAFVVGVLPALRATGRDLQSRLRQMGGGTHVQMGATWTVLVVAQVAVAVGVLPVVVGIGVGALWTPLPDPAFPAAEVLTFNLHRDRDPYAADRDALDAAFSQAQSRFIDRVAAEPGVAGLTFARHLPLFAPRTAVEIDDVHVTGTRVHAQLNAVDPGYFRVLGVPLVAGREFGPADLADGAAAAMVNRTFVERYLDGRPALGTRVRPSVEGSDTDGGGWYVVTGIVGDVYVNRVRPDLTPAAIYLPLQPASEPLALAARTRGTTPRAAAGRVRAVAADVASDWPLTVSSMEQINNGPHQQFTRLAATLVALMTLSVLLLSAAGISALMSFAVTQRRREIGIRVALGASRGRVMRAIFMRPARQLGLGLASGALAAAALDKLTGGQMLDGRAVLLVPMVAVLMVIAGLLATMRPASRAMRIHPVQVLRD